MSNRKPAETLEFTGVKPGDQIAELLPGGGYFTRLFSKVVGSSGHVYALVPAPPPDAPADTPDFAARIKTLAGDPKYSNLSVVVEPFSELKTPVPVDLVWTSQNYHDLHNFPGLDVGVFNQMVFDALKPGGLYVILDHAAAPGSGTNDTKTLHRIDRETVKKEVHGRGFRVRRRAANCWSSRAIRTRRKCSILPFAAKPTNLSSSFANPISATPDGVPAAAGPEELWGRFAVNQSGGFCVDSVWFGGS